jgi:hypothetical protein
VAAPEAHIYRVEDQSTPQAESIQALDLVQLYLDPVYDIEQFDSIIRARKPRSRPGLARLLTARRDAMRALAAQLLPGDAPRP